MLMSDPESGFHALRRAVAVDLETARRLLEADPALLEAKNPLGGQTVLHFFVVEDALDAVAWLLDQGADINTWNSYAATPLMDAAQRGQRRMCRLLLDRGADVRIRDGAGETALSRAGEFQPGLVELLLEALEPDEEVSSFFTQISAHYVFEQGGHAAELLRARGLVDPWPEFTPAGPDRGSM
jgi:ankyrin repeat protein